MCVYPILLQPFIQGLQGARWWLALSDVLFGDLKGTGLLLDGVVGKMGKLPLVGVVGFFPLITLVILLGGKSYQAFLVQKNC